MTAAFALMLAAAGVGLGHAVLPDHWLPLAVFSRTQRYSLRRTLRVSAAAGVTHVLVSLVLGAVVIAVGLRFRSTVERHADLVVGGLLALTGWCSWSSSSRAGARRPTATGMGTATATTRPARAGRLGRLAAVVVPFGAAASPDLTILPVFLAASAVGVTAAVGTLVVFALVTLAAIVGLTLAATAGGYRLRGGWLDRYANPVTALVLLVIGALIGTGSI